MAAVGESSLASNNMSLVTPTPKKAKLLDIATDPTTSRQQQQQQNLHRHPGVPATHMRPPQPQAAHYHHHQMQHHRVHGYRPQLSNPHLHHQMMGHPHSVHQMQQRHHQQQQPRGPYPHMHMNSTGIHKPTPFQQRHQAQQPSAAGVGYHGSHTSSFAVGQQSNKNLAAPHQTMAASRQLQRPVTTRGTLHQRPLPTQTASSSSSTTSSSTTVDNKINSSAAVATSTQDSGIYSRKKKSLGVLATNFLHKYDNSVPGTEVIVDDAAIDLGVERRRVSVVYCQRFFDSLSSHCHIV